LIEFTIQSNDYDIIGLNCEIDETNYNVICPIDYLMNLVYDKKYYLHYFDSCQSNINTSINVLSVTPYFNEHNNYHINSAYNIYKYNVKNIFKISLIFIFCLFS